jgi:hypothetical protein
MGIGHVIAGGDILDTGTTSFALPGQHKHLEFFVMTSWFAKELLNHPDA